MMQLRPWHLLLLVPATLLVSCARGEPESPTPTPIAAATPVPKPTFVVQRGEVTSQLAFAALMAGQSEQRLSFDARGTVQEILVAPGDVVTAGQVLARLDVAEVEQSLAAARSELELLERDAARALRKAELSLEIAQRTLELYRVEGRSALQMQIAALQVELAQLELDETTNNATLQSRRDRVAELEAAIAGSRLVSPVDSHVLEVLVAPGRVVEESTAVLSLGDPSTLEARAWLPPDNQAGLEESMPVTVTAEDGSLASLAGSIVALPPPLGHGADSAIHMAFATPYAASEAGYRLGGRVRVAATVERRSDVLWLPPQAVHDVGGRTFVILREGDAQRTADVRIGLVTPERVEIVEGVAEGQVATGP
jgi:HlyD family secretion protein